MTSRHLDNFRQPPPPSVTFLAQRLIYCRHKSLDPCHYHRDVIFGRRQNNIFLRILEAQRASRNANVSVDRKAVRAELRENCLIHSDLF